MILQSFTIIHIFFLCKMHCCDNRLISGGHLKSAMTSSFQIDAINNSCTRANGTWN